jgi:hypothetical protein
MAGVAGFGHGQQHVAAVQGPALTSPIRSMPELIEALRCRARELQLTHETIDSVAGLQSGYTSKLLAPKPIKNLGPMSFESLLGALGVAVVVIDDPEQVKRISMQWTKRTRPLKPSPSIMPSMPNEVPLQIAVTPQLQAQLRDSSYMRKIGLRGAAVRNYRLSARRRKMIAKQAARARWAKEGP